MFERHLPEKWHDVAPKLVRRDDGSEVWLYEDKELPNIGLNAVVGRPPEEYGLEPTSFDEMREGCWDIDQRVRDMNANGVIGSMCFPSFPQLCGQLFARTKDKDLALAVLKAYNDCHVDDWCAAWRTSPDLRSWCSEAGLGWTPSFHAGVDYTCQIRAA